MEGSTLSGLTYVLSFTVPTLLSVNQGKRRFAKGEREGGVRRSLQEEKMIYLLAQSDGRETIAVLEDTRFIQTGTCTIHSLRTTIILIIPYL